MEFLVYLKIWRRIKFRNRRWSSCTSFFRRNFNYPGISIDYRSTNNKWLAQFYWPKLNVLYNVSPNTQIGLAGSIDWTRFKLKSFRGYNGKEADYAQFSSIHGGLQVNQRIAGGIWLQVQGRRRTFNSYELFDKTRKQ